MWYVNYISIKKPINIIYHINSLKKYIILSIDAEKAYHKIQYSFVIKTLRKLGIGGHFLNLIKKIYQKPNS